MHSGGKSWRHDKCDTTGWVRIDDFSRVPVSVAVDDTHAYWINTASGLAGVYQVPKAGGSALQLARVIPFQNDGFDWALATDGYFVFFVEGGQLDGSGGTAGRVVRIDGPGVETELARGSGSLCAGAGHPFSITLDGDRVYFTEEAARLFPPSGSGCDPGPVHIRYLRSVPKCGGDAHFLGPVTSRNVVIVDGVIYATDAGGLVKIDPESGERTQSCFAVPDDSVVAFHSDLGALAGTPTGAILSQDGPVYIPAAGDGRITQLLVDGDDLYWIDAQRGLRRLRLHTGAVELLEAGARSVGVDDDFVYATSSVVERRCKDDGRRHR